MFILMTIILNSKKTLLNVGNKSVREEVTHIFYNLPSLFV